MDMSWLKPHIANDTMVKRRKTNGGFEYLDASIMDCELEPCTRCKLCDGWFRPKNGHSNLVIRCKRPPFTEAEWAAAMEANKA